MTNGFDVSGFYRGLYRSIKKRFSRRKKTVAPSPAREGAGNGIDIPLATPESALLITLDSCRYDTFLAAEVPNMKAVGPLHRAMAPGNFTYSSHMAMFMGFTPGVAAKIEDYVNSKHGKIFRVRGQREKRGTHIALKGRNIIDGFKKKGYITIGTGAAGWFNPETAPGMVLTEDFDKFYFPGNYHSLRSQLDFIAGAVSGVESPVFVFLNVCETHVPYYHDGAPWSRHPNPCVPFSKNNDATECRRRQIKCVEYADGLLAPLIDAFRGSTTVICADHGDCWGEDGLWEHGIHHEKVLEVPLLFRLNGNHTEK